MVIKLVNRFHSGLMWLLILSTAILVTSCASTMLQFPNFDSSVINGPEHMKEIDGLFVGIHPIVDKYEMGTYFKSDLSSKNILAVFISVENRTDTLSYIVSKDDIFLKINDKRVRKQYDTNETQVGDDTNAKIVDVMGAILVAPVLLGIGPGMISDAGTTRHNFLSKEMVPFTTLFPGRSTGGFKYFKMPENGIAASSLLLLLEVNIKELISESITTVNFNLNMEGTNYDDSKKH